MAGRRMRTGETEMRGDFPMRRAGAGRRKFIFDECADGFLLFRQTLPLLLT